MGGGELMKVLKTMQKSLRVMLILLICVIAAGVVLGGLFVRQRWIARQERQARYEEQANERAEEIRITFIPGRSIFSNRRMLIERGFSEAEVDAAFRRQYDVMTRLGRPTTLTGVTAVQVAGARNILDDNFVSIEGFLFPETINFFATTSVENIVSRMATELERAVLREGLIEQFNAMNMTFYQGLILASIVEGEISGNHADAPAIAAVFHRRLRAGWTLGADITSLYAANLMGVPVHNPDGSPNHAILRLESPWNTRHSQMGGLPPTPIGSPSLAAIRATANPDFDRNPGAFYFLTGDSGATYFARTETEHQMNIRNHCRERCQNW